MRFIMICNSSQEYINERYAASIEVGAHMPHTPMVSHFADRPLITTYFSSCLTPYTLPDLRQLICSYALQQPQEMVREVQDLLARVHYNIKKLSPALLERLHVLGREVSFLTLRIRNGISTNKIKRIFAAFPYLSSIRIKGIDEKPRINKSKSVLAALHEISQHYPHLRRLFIDSRYTILPDAFQTIVERCREIRALEIEDQDDACCDERTGPLCRQIARLPQLEQLSLYLKRLKNVDLDTVTRTSSLIRVLKLDGCRQLTDASIPSILQLKRLVVLDLSSCRSMTPAALLQLSALTHLRDLHLVNIPNVDETARRFTGNPVRIHMGQGIIAGGIIRPPSPSQASVSDEKEEELEEKMADLSLT